METLPIKNTNAKPALSFIPSVVAMSVEIGIERMTISVATFVKVEIVTDDIECTAEQRCSPGGGLQFDEIGVHQKAIRNMWRRKVAAVKTHATASVILARFPWSEKML